MFLKALVITAFLVTANHGFASTEDVKQKASETADEFKQTMNEKLSKLKSQIDKLEVDAKSSTGKAKVSVNERLQALETRRGLLKRQLNETSEQSGRAWAQMKKSMSRAMNDLQVGIRNAKAEIKAKTGRKTE
jgi:uncharacterized protein YicC (UPF0701 family)